MKKYNITIVGAGSSRTPALIGSIVDYKDKFPIKKIVFYDIDLERMKKMHAYISLVLKKEMPTLQFTFTDDKSIAYCDCDAVLVQMRAGNSEM